MKDPWRFPGVFAKARQHKKEASGQENSGAVKI